MTEDTYLTLDRYTEGLYKEKGSRFLAFGYPIESEEEALTLVKQLKDKYHDARHHCWAYRLGLKGEIYRVNDDGEPSGTAGRPIYGAILSRGISDVVFVVVRYFGGIKLGTSGLIDAYRTATKDAIDNSVIIEKQVMKKIAFTFPYEQVGKIMKLLKVSDAKIVHSDFNLPCHIKAEIRAGEYEALSDSLSKVEGINFETIYQHQ